LLRVAADARQAGSNVETELDGALQELGAVKLLEVRQHFGDGDGRELSVLGAGDASETVEGGAHATGFRQDGLDASALALIECGGFFE
jgi:hypothetical protein